MRAIPPWREWELWWGEGEGAKRGGMKLPPGKRAITWRRAFQVDIGFRCSWQEVRGGQGLSPWPHQG
jgi:hypothetical protein